MGREALEIDAMSNKSATVVVRVSSQQKSLIEERAAAAGCASVSEFLRGQALEEVGVLDAKVPKIRSLVRELTAEFYDLRYENQDRQQRVAGLLIELEEQLS